jgi:lysozyme
LPLPLAAKWEGYSPTVYKDSAGIPTYCYGETEMLRHDPAHIYAKTECMALLRSRMQRDYAPKIAACLPEIVGNRFVFGALIDASYNAGPIAVCRSPMAQLIRAGRVAEHATDCRPGM